MTLCLLPAVWPPHRQVLTELGAESPLPLWGGGGGRERDECD